MGEISNGMNCMSDTLRDLQRPGLRIRCPNCGESFPVKRARLFDATGELPDYAVEYLASEREALADERRKLRERRAMLKRRSAAGAEACGVGQILEMVTASLPGLPAETADCRALLKPIDYIAFEGASRGKVKSIRFIEVKSGRQRLPPVQRSIRAAVEAGCITLRVADHRVPDPQFTS